ncbi:HAD family hydrolase [Hephaestia sp. GCM10023244]|uniref:HAD family hydrolase n=1 Tax=unclassified Hephaestia TaxID=2631281 RepID=UPI002076F4CC|nr:HAD-IB family hydrolase [Hephaestia sp. MAHUQ-44]MCM8729719.1 HAD-IB family hydrolase [Hephaestia sp. MAHUQ-44]
MQRLAIYDMDRTITHAPTWTPFLWGTMRRHAPWRMTLVPAAVVAALGYVAKVIDRARLKQTMQRLLLGGSLAPEAVEAAAEAFAERVTATGVFAGARERIAADRAAGYRLVMATASYRFYVNAIAQRLGFDDVIATEAEIDETGRLYAKMVGDNVYGPAKLAAIEAWLAREGIDRKDCHIRFYSDHVSDAPVLRWADEPFAVNAHGPLRALARKRGWPIVDWER